ncbi:cytochrome P460 family protein [Pendulispora albinea]|uniref:Cytochrome P460 family protein n=1 Tax=Pendulispora albinea TaxID=2741071 RepID=A0ABZ2M338_9BACT
MNDRARWAFGVALCNFCVAGLGIAGCGAREPAPADTRNELASLPATSELDPHGWKVITSAIHRNDGTMSTLFGNDIAVKASRAGQMPYPPGADLSWVTWASQEDAHWFGAKIPGKVQSVERVRFETAGGQPSYDKYEGSPWTKHAVEPAAAAERVAYIVRQRASVMP